MYSWKGSTTTITASTQPSKHKSMINFRKSIIDLALSSNSNSALPLTEELKPSGSLRSLKVPTHPRNFHGTSSSSTATLSTKGTKAYRLLGENRQDFILTPSTTNGIRPRPHNRLISKTGEINVSRCNIEKQGQKYLADIFTTLIDLSWRWGLGLFMLGFISSWFTFAFIWYAIAFAHNDIDHANRTPRNASHEFCVSGVHDFVSALLFSIETQQTIGYGTRAAASSCPINILVIMIQSILGVMLQSFMVGVVFAKISRPKKRSETLMWSKHAVICLRDGRFSLLCRVGDMRKSHIVEAHVRMYLIKKVVTREGEVLPLTMLDCNVGYDRGIDRVFLIWPLMIEHVIDSDSPLYNIAPNDLSNQRFEIVIVLEGIIESTGMTTQARTSYLPSEILWGHRFERLIAFQRDNSMYRIDYSCFHKTYAVDTPMVSAKVLDNMEKQEAFDNGSINAHDSDTQADRYEPYNTRV